MTSVNVDESRSLNLRLLHSVQSIENQVAKLIIYVPTPISKGNFLVGEEESVIEAAAHAINSNGKLTESIILAHKGLVFSSK